MKMLTATKLVIKAFFWVVLAPILALPYFFAVTKIVELVPGSKTDYETNLDWFQNSFVIAYLSIALLFITAPLIGVGTHFLNRWSQRHFGNLACWLLCATIVGWFHCTSYMLFGDEIISAFNLVS